MGSYDESGSSGIDPIGANQPLQMPFHRIFALAAAEDPAEAAAQPCVRHVCGNKYCCVVSHFRAGSVRDNTKDKLWHVHNRGSSRTSHERLQ